MRGIVDRIIDFHVYIIPLDYGVNSIVLNGIIMSSVQTLFLGTKPSILFFRAAIPGAIGMIASNIYFSFEMLLVGRFLGQTAFAGGNLAMPLLLIAYAVADMIAVGSSIVISLKLGEGQREEADRIFTAAVISASLLATIAAVLLTLSGPWFFRIMGADEPLISEAMKYLGVYTLFMPLSCLVFVFDNYLKICGRVRFSMVMNIVLAVLSLTFELIFLYVLRRGIGFAALGTSLGMSITCIICMMPFIKGRMALHFVRTRFSPGFLKEIFTQGLPSFLNNMSGRITSILMNTLLLHLGGGIAVSIYGVFMNIDSIIVPGMYGVFDSLQPAIGYNWGAGRKDRAAVIARYCVIALALLCLVFSLAIEFFPGEIFSLFLESGSKEIELAVHAISIMGLMYLVRWISYSCQSFSSAIGNNREATVLSLCSALIFPLLMMFILRDTGLEGLWYVMPASALLTSVVSVIIYFVQIRKIIAA